MEAAKEKQSTPMSSPKVAFGSPKFRNRLEEKEELQNLNDRFAVYIDKIRQLEDKNSTLDDELALQREEAQRKISEQKKLYEGELANTRQLLDEICKEKSRIELENSKSSARVKDLQKKLESEQQELKRLSDRNLYLDKKVNESEATIATLRYEQRTLKDQYTEVAKEHKSLQGVHDSTNTQLEERTLEKVNLENRIQTLIEDLDFRNRAHEQEVSKLKEEIDNLRGNSVVDGGTKEQYDSVLRNKLQELRDEFEVEAENIKLDVENTYKLKLDDTQNNCNKLRDECGNQLAIIRDLRSSLETLKVEKSVLESEVNSLKKHISELDQLRATERDDYAKHLKEKENEIRKLNSKIDDLDKEYEDLMGVKVALDIEINAYRKLLEGEEQRLNITPPLQRGKKRRRSESDVAEPPVISTAKGSVHIVQCDASGKFIKIKNTGSNEEPLGGWVLRRVSDEKEPVEFKFSPRSILKGDATVCVWSSSSGTKHKPPSDLVMKSQDWGSGTNSVTTLHNSEGDVVAQLTETSRPKSRKKRPESGNDSCIVS